MDECSNEYDDVIISAFVKPVSENDSDAIVNPLDYLVNRRPIGIKCTRMSGHDGLHQKIVHGNIVAEWE